MKRGIALKKSISLLLLFISVPLFSQGAKLNIAVSDLAGQGIDQSSTAIISDRLRTSLFKEGGFNVLERNAMQDILKEQGFQQSGCTSDACAVEIGQLLGVSYIIVGTVGKLGHLFTIDIRMIEVATAKIAYSESVDCDCPIEKVLTSSIVSIAKKITENVKSTSAKATASEKATQEKSAPSAAPSQDTAKPAAGMKKAEGAAAVGPKPKKSPVLKITLGVVTLAAAGAGYAFDNMLKGKIDDNARLTAEYKSQPGNTQYAEYSGKISDNNKSANTDQNLRNACYVISGLGLVGFVISFWF
jgi:TolB-like protein